MHFYVLGIDRSSSGRKRSRTIRLPRRRRVRARNPFIDDEAALSGSDSGDEDEQDDDGHDSQHSLAVFINNEQTDSGMHLNNVESAAIR